MAKKHVHSQDPRKPAIVAAFKRKFGASKVTLLTETAPGVFQGSLLKFIGNRVYENLGYRTITTAEIERKSAFEDAELSAKTISRNAESVPKGKWYHTGFDSYDNPEVREFVETPGYKDRRFENGPFDSFGAAKRDLQEAISADIDNLVHFRRRVLKLSASRPEGNMEGTTP